MNLPSLKNIKDQFVSIVTRFYGTLTVSFVGAVAAIIQVESYSYDYYGEPNTLVTNLVVTCLLGFFVFLAIELKAQRGKKYGMLLRGLGLAFLVGYFFILPDAYFASEGFPHVVRTVLYSLAFFTAIMFAPFTFHKEINGFWHHNKQLFIRTFFTGIFTGALYLGLTLALYSSDTLLGIRFDYDLYFQLWIFVIGFIAVPFFLAGIPENLAGLEKEKDYPKGLKIFSQYILLPLFFLYGLILYSYGAKILFTGEWPQGMVTSLVIAFAALGILTYFLLYPLLNDKKTRWMKTISKLIFVLILPMTGMLFWSIYMRLQDYGLTVNRYFVILAGVWLLFIALYFLISKKQNIKLIPTSLFAILILCTFGPWGAFWMAEANQLARVEAVLLENDLLVDGKVVQLKDGGTLSQEDEQKLYGALEYLNHHHDLSGVQGWFEGRKDLDKACLQDYYCLAQEGIGVNSDYYGGWVESDYYSFYPSYQDTYSHLSTVEVTGYDYVISNFSYYGYDEEYMGDFGVQIKNDVLVVKDEPFGQIEIDLSSLIALLTKEPRQSERSQEELTVETEKAKLIISSIDFTDLEKDTRTLNSLYGTLLIKK